MDNTSPTPEQGATPAQGPTPFESARLLLKELNDKFPVFRKGLPLATGIDKQIIGRMPEVNRRVLRIALGIHTHSMRYLKAMEKGTTRHDLDENAAGEITDAHREHATTMLQERLKKDAERRKTERKASEAQKKQEQVERQREQKLSQLVEKFSRR
ncbi:ProQ/FINO family protein [Noviherbaspirillum humi]|nr:ProQ/FinO family protein [Noviherbaspirillum humi]